MTLAALALARRRWPLGVLLASAATLQVYYLFDYLGFYPGRGACGRGFHGRGSRSAPLVAAGGRRVGRRPGRLSGRW